MVDDARIARYEQCMTAQEIGDTAMTERLWTAQEVAEFLSVSRPQVYKLVKTGKLHCIEIPEQTMRFDPAHVRAQMEAWTKTGADVVQDTAQDDEGAREQ